MAIQSKKFKHSVTFGGNGKLLADLLLNAAGLNGKQVKSLTCHCDSGSVITFEADFMADDDRVGDALKEVDVAAIAEGFERKELMQ